MFGAYGIDRQIGAGGMGAVFAATDPKLNRQVALKVVLGEHAMSPTFLQRFQHEAAVLARLDSPHVISVYDHGEQDGCAFIVVQYAAGGDLREMLRHGALSRHAAVDLCAQVADGLVAAHGVGVVHRDVKPANVLLRDARVDRLHAYLCDFGVALTESSGLTAPGALAGTWNYLAPELSRGESASPSSDVYAVGCLLWECLTGSPPYAGSDVEVAMGHLSGPVPQLRGTDPFTEHANHVLARSLAKDPTHRYPGATELRDDLRALAASIAPRPGAPIRRSRRGLVVAVGAVAALAVAGGITAFALTRDGAQAPAPPDPDDPAAAAVVQGDIDGDGLGDVAMASLEEAYLYRSDGQALAGSPDRIADVDRPVLTGHFDDDGTPFVLVDKFPPAVALRIADLDSRGPSSLLRTKAAESIDYPDASAGDFDGDGLDDVLIRVTTERGTTITVGINDGDGTFAPAATWYTDDLPEGGFAVGDLDDDGDDDLVQLSFGDITTDTPASTTVLMSTGSGFERTGSQEPSDSQLASAAQLADVDGDGRVELVTAQFFNSVALVWEWDGEKFAEPDSWLPGDQLSNDDSLLLSDVNGDGRADLVTAGEGGGAPSLRVFLSTGKGFEPAPEWTTTVRPPEGADLVGPSQLQTFLQR